jgi:hypothetical protein
MQYEHNVSAEPLAAIEAQGCHFGEELSVSRFRRLFNEIEQLRCALDEISQDAETAARNSFARSCRTFEADWKAADPEGYACWRRARNAIGEGA